jgi:hypothetical protein
MKWQVKHSGYKNCKNWLPNRTTYLLENVMTLSPIQSRITHSLFDIISLGVDKALRHCQDNVWQFVLLHVAQCHDKKVKNIKFCPRVLRLSKSMCYHRVTHAFATCIQWTLHRHACHKSQTSLCQIFTVFTLLVVKSPLSLYVLFSDDRFQSNIDNILTGSSNCKLYSHFKSLFIDALIVSRW